MSCSLTVLRFARKQTLLNLREDRNSRKEEDMQLPHYVETSISPSRQLWLRWICCLMLIFASSAYGQNRCASDGLFGTPGLECSEVQFTDWYYTALNLTTSHPSPDAAAAASCAFAHQFLVLHSAPVVTSLVQRLLPIDSGACRKVSP